METEVSLGAIIATGCARMRIASCEIRCSFRSKTILYWKMVMDKR